jgi:hypothetical protein
MCKEDDVRRFIKSLCFCNPERIAKELLNASSHETYVETVSKSADTIHLGLIDWNTVCLERVYSRFCENKIRKLHLGSCDVCIDITEEDFYGKIEGLWIHPWTGEAGVKGHFKFLVCSVKCRNNKFPIGAVMIHVGAVISDAIAFLLESCKTAGLCIRTVLLDRGFYSADILRELHEQDVFYLVFAKKSVLFKNMLESTKRSVVVEHELVLLKNKTKTRIPTSIALVKNINDYDWVFATNLDLSGREIVKRYRIRWNIETDFRVMDEARIKSKSKRAEVRLFYFLISCLLLFVWNATQKFCMTFKKFVIIQANSCLQNKFVRFV